MEENINQDNQPEKDHTGTKPLRGSTLLGYNVLAMVGYTLFLTLVSRDSGFIFDAVVLSAHVFICLLASLFERSWWWFLSALVVLAIGFSTCAMIATMR
ncbi:MAG: hypothetical protein JWR02_2708 [Mucilaginibacter sp.]|nr:hypothetical protein [Mucilaginibacter sp.]